MTEIIRTFIAIDLSDEHRAALDRVQMQFKAERASRYVRWVAPSSIHLTLKFLGDVETAQMPALFQAVTDACVGIAPFTLQVSGAGAFPNTRRPNVVWVGVQGEVERATVLAKKIKEACAALGFPREDRAFSPHLTLGRVKRETSSNDRRLVGEMIEQANVGDLGEIHVAQVNVIKSELRMTGSIYTRLHEVRLLGG